jgi:hypothetical protein
MGTAVLVCEDLAVDVAQHDVHCVDRDRAYLAIPQIIQSCGT